MTIKLYKVFCAEAPMMKETGFHYALTPWGSDTLIYKGEDDGGQEYNLPAGFELVEYADGHIGIESEEGIPCRVITHSDKPVLECDYDHYYMAVA